MKRTALLLLSLLLWISACTTATNPSPASTPATTSVSQPPQESAYPSLIGGQSAPYPAPSEDPSSSVTPGPVPTPDANTAVITGRILLNGKILPKDGSVYLAEMIKDDQQVNSIASFDPANSPRAFLDSEGKFAFANVAPGDYGLVLDFVVTNFMLGYPNGSGVIQLVAKAGQTVDLGTLDYPDLPIPNP